VPIAAGYDFVTRPTASLDIGSVSQGQGALVKGHYAHDIDKESKMGGLQRTMARMAAPVKRTLRAEGMSLEGRGMQKLNGGGD